MAVMRIGIAAVMSLPIALGFYFVHTVPAWLAAHALTTVVHRLLGPWRPPLWTLCIAGSIGQALLLSPYYRFLFDAVQPYLIAGVQLSGKPSPAWSVEYVLVLLSELAPGALIWIAANYAWDRVLGIPRFRYEITSLSTPWKGVGASPVHGGTPARIDVSDAAATETVVPTALSNSACRPTFLATTRLPPDAEVLAITAEEHYVRVITDRGADLVRHRFAEAVAELADETRGMQVHRSWWLRLDAVVKTVEKGRSLELTLCDGTVVPVSFAFREAVLRSRQRP